MLTRQRPPLQGCLWLIGYKLIFVIACIRAAVSYALIERIRHTQLLAFSTTGRSKTLALHREKRLSEAPASIEEERYSKRSFGQLEQIPFHLYDRYNGAQVFWYMLTTFVWLYNTIHLALTPLAHVTPLFFGTPTYVVYWGFLRCVQIVLG